MYSAKGYTDPGNGAYIQLNIKLIEMLEHATKEDFDATLLIVIEVLLHEENHRGNTLYSITHPGSRYDGDPGSAFSTEIYGHFNAECNCKVDDDDFQSPIYIADYAGKPIKGAKSIINEKKSRKEDQDLPKMTWADVNGWIDNAQKINPDIVVNR